MFKVVQVLRSVVTLLCRYEKKIINRLIASLVILLKLLDNFWTKSELNIRFDVAYRVG